MFNIGDKVTHPMHGAGIIERIDEKKVNNKLCSFYVVKILTGDMNVLVPVESCEAIGVRPILSKEDAETMLDSFSGIEVDMTQNWNKRYRENMDKIKSGNLLEVAEVVKGLMCRDVERGLSTGERKMLHSAKQILISELVIALNTDYEKIEMRLSSSIL